MTRDRAAIMSLLADYADPDGRIALPILSEHVSVGVARRTPEEITCVEAFVDDHGTVWTPPTAWAYFAVCRARDNRRKELTDLIAEATALCERLDAFGNEIVDDDVGTEFFGHVGPSHSRLKALLEELSQ